MKSVFPHILLMLLLVACDLTDTEDANGDYKMEIFQGDEPHVVAGSAVRPEPGVSVTRDGEPVSGETVRFEVEGDHGMILEDQATTNHNGRAFFDWFMEPDYLEEHRVTASYNSQTSEFSATPVRPDPDSSYFGRSQYIEYQPGTSPIILATSHGGDLEPDEIPDRTWGVKVRDLNTRELTLKIADEIEDQTGDRPHVVITHLRRTKLDANREIEEAAQENPHAERAWKEYHRWTETAKAIVTEDFGSGFYVDVHGHGHSIQRLELGYLLRSDDLNQSDSELDDAGLASSSSIRNLSEEVEVSLSELLRGEYSLGEIMEREGYPSVPSASDPGPGDNPFFSGGYSTVHHGSRDGGTIDGVQLEANFDDVRDTEENRQEFAESFSRGLIQFLNRYAAMDL